MHHHVDASKILGVGRWRFDERFGDVCTCIQYIFHVFHDGDVGRAWEDQDLTRTQLDFSTAFRIDTNHPPRYPHTSDSPSTAFLIREEKIGSISYTLFTIPDGVQHRRSVLLQFPFFNEIFPHTTLLLFCTYIAPLHRWAGSDLDTGCYTTADALWRR